HRAAVGMSEKFDSLSLVVSEETGSISIAIDGELQRHLVPEQLEEILRAELLVHDLQNEEPKTEESAPHFFDTLLDKLPGFGRRKK
ncbi:diadenylate cyclase, partial [Butyricicoccus sp.]|uniref:diadenylate cyclase n=1 Tax=Butyricicoccus sp. TaxID=2049021 RepID=UPI003D7DDD98